MQHPLCEGLKSKDLKDLVKNVFEVDSYKSKMGEDDSVVVLAFEVTGHQAALDFVDFVEKGYNFVLDADVSPGEISPGRYLVYIELRRRSQAGTHLAEAIDDFNTLTEFKPDQWIMVYKDKEYPFSKEEFDRRVPLSPKLYRKEHEDDLNEVRAAAGIDTVQIYEREADIRQLQAAAGQI